MRKNQDKNQNIQIKSVVCQKMVSAMRKTAKEKENIEGVAILNKVIMEGINR